MMRTLSLLLLLVLAGCAGDPPPSVPPMRKAAESANRSAVIAAQAQHWGVALESWREALTAYQAIDDWVGQGRARLGMAQAYARTDRNDLAEKTLLVMPDQDLFVATQRAQAAYQLALLVAGKNEALAQARLESARQLCTSDCMLQPQLDNLAARLALQKSDYSAVVVHAGLALAGAKNLPAERAYSHRLLAEAALGRDMPQQAKVELEAALVDDRLLAEPMWLQEDYRLLVRVAQRLGDPLLQRDAELRLESVCTAAGLPDCGGKAR